MVDLADVFTLELTLEASVEPRYLDSMGHMNVAFYVDLFNRGVWTFFGRHGLDEAYLRASTRGMFALEESVRYLSELREGDALSVYTGVFEARHKTLRLGQYMVDERKQVLSATREVVAAHIDLSSRRSVAFEELVFEQLAAAPVALPLSGTMTEAAAQQFAREWVDAWNRRDAEAVLSHYAEEAVFVSPKAQQIVGTARLAGKAALRAYWQAALSRITSLRFTLDAASWSPRAQTLSIVYLAALGDAPPVRATEIMRFRDGLVVHGEALYGAQA
jgi:acyl-CoA thioesterase FadM